MWAQCRAGTPRGVGGVSAGARQLASERQFVKAPQGLQWPGVFSCAAFGLDRIRSGDGTAVAVQISPPVVELHAQKRSKSITRKNDWANDWG